MQPLIISPSRASHLHLENHIQLSHHIQFFTMSSKALEMLWPLAHLSIFSFYVFLIGHSLLPSWLLWDLSLLSQVCSCHRAFASAIPSYWTLQDEIVQRFRSWLKCLILSENMHCWFSLLSRAHQYEITCLFMIISPLKKVDSMKERRDVSILST